MNAIVEQALTLWGMAGAHYALVAERENAVFKVTTDHGCLALRLHRKGYRTDQELWSELKWMEVAARGGIDVPKPVPSPYGKVLHAIDGVQVDVLTWLSGAPLADLFDTLGPNDRADVFYAVGQQMAHLHDISDAWAPPTEFHRCAWNQAGLLGAAPLWGRFWENPTLTNQDRALLTQFRATAQADLARMESTLDYGLIHADLVSANIMLDGTHVRLIDFDDGGFGFRLFEIATTLLKFMAEPDYDHLRTALIQGYTSVRAINLGALDLFLALRAATYVGWAITRQTHDNTADRTTRFIAAARQRARAYLER